MSTDTTGKAATLGAPQPPSSINLDTARTARREAMGDAIEVTNQGEAFRLPVELPVDAIEPLADLAGLEEQADGQVNPATLKLMRTALERGLAALFCTCAEIPTDDATGWTEPHRGAHERDCQWPRFLRTRPSMGDELELWSGLFVVYGTSLGEALASLDSSQSDGTPSTQTGNGSTPATRGTSGAARKTAKGARTSRR